MLALPHAFLNLVASMFRGLVAGFEGGMNHVG